MSNDPYFVKDNEHLIQKIGESRAALASTWKGLSEEEMTRIPGPQPDRSVKDMIAHLMWWEIYALNRITIIASGEQIVLMDEFDAVNDLVYRQFKTMPLANVMAVWENNLAQIEAMMPLFSFEGWSDENRENAPGLSLLRLLAVNTFGHYSDHQEDMERYVRGLQK